MDFYLIRVKCRENLAFLKLSKEELNAETFRQKALSEFGVSQHMNFHVKLLDMMSTPISDDIFIDVIEKFNSCPTFFIELFYQIDFENTAKIVTPFIVKEYFIQNGFDYILKEQLKNKNLSELTRVKMIAALCDFMFTFFGTRSLQKSQKLTTIAVALQIFPQMQSQNTSNGGVDILLGYIDNRLKYVTRKSKALMAETGGEDKNDEDAENTSDEFVTEMSDLINDMKSWTISADGLDSIKTNLRKTRNYRKKMMLDGKTDLLESFPYFFVNIDLVLFEFEDRFNDVDTQSLVENWKKYGAAIKLLLEQQYEKSSFVTTWPEEIEQILSLLKLLPSTRVGKNSLKNRKTFHRATTKLFVFRTVGTPPEKLIEKENDHPYIIACGENPDKIIRFYIEVEKHLISMPHDFDAIRTFDVFFKLIKIFDLHFDKNIVPMMNFIQHFIYKLLDNEIKPTTRMQDVFNRMIRQIEPHMDSESDLSEIELIDE